MQNDALLRIFVRFCAFLCVYVLFVVPKWHAEKRKFAHNRAKMCKKRFYAIPPLVIPPFACHRLKHDYYSTVSPSTKDLFSEHTRRNRANPLLPKGKACWMTSECCRMTPLVCTLVRPVSGRKGGGVGGKVNIPWTLGDDWGWGLSAPQDGNRHELAKALKTLTSLNRESKPFLASEKGT